MIETGDEDFGTYIEETTANTSIVKFMANAEVAFLEKALELARQTVTGQIESGFVSASLAHAELDMEGIHNSGADVWIRVHFINTDDGSIALVMDSGISRTEMKHEEFSFGPDDLHKLTPQFLTDRIVDVLRQPYKPKLKSLRQRAD